MLRKTCSEIMLFCTIVCKTIASPLRDKPLFSKVKEILEMTQLSKIILGWQNLKKPPGFTKHWQDPGYMNPALLQRPGQTLVPVGLNSPFLYISLCLSARFDDPSLLCGGA